MHKAIEFSATSATTLFSVELGAYDTTVSVQIVTPGTATVTYEVSNDGTNWIATGGCTPGPAGSAVTTTTAAGISVFYVQTRYFRARVSAYTSGTVAGVAMLGTGWNK